MGQIIPLQNLPQDLDNYICKENQTKMLVPLYDTTNNKFKGIKQTLAYVMLRGNKNEFFTYEYSEENCQVLFS